MGDGTTDPPCGRHISGTFLVPANGHDIAGTGTRRTAIVLLDMHTAFLEFSRRKLLEQYRPRLRQCVESLSDEQVWWRPNEASNSIGNLILHLDGNVRQWLVSSFKGLEDTRNRPAEFREQRMIPAPALLEKLDITMNEASDVLAVLTEADLLTTFNIQGYTVNGLQAVYQVVEHFAMHYGQILYISKLLRGEDLGFYRELDKTGRLG
jgi:uncharacterized damage-inducible protein DinB